MKITDIFKTSKKPFNLKLNGYIFLGVHPEFNTVYFARNFDDNNFDIAVMQVLEEKGKFNIPKYTYLAGSKIMVIDTFMINYLKNKENNHDKVIEQLKIDKLEFKKMFTSEIPEEMADYREITMCLDNGYKILYVKNNDSVVKKFGNTIDVVFYKEVVASEESTYILFKQVEFIKKKDGKSYFVFDFPEIQIPTFILK